MIPAHSYRQARALAAEARAAQHEQEAEVARLDPSAPSDLERESERGKWLDLAKRYRALAERLWAEERNERSGEVG